MSKTQDIPKLILISQIPAVISPGPFFSYMITGKFRSRVIYISSDFSDPK